MTEVRTDVHLDGHKIADMTSEMINEREVVRREFDAEISAGDGRTIDVRIVPYGVAAEVSDGGPAYREMWLPGAFSDQVRGALAGRAKKVLVNFEHRQSLGDVIGKGTMLREEADGFYGSFEILDTPDGDKALMLARDGILNGISMEAYALKFKRRHDGVVQRIKGHLKNIALCRSPAYADAAVLAFREEDQFTDFDDLLPPAPDTETLGRCAELGIVLPDDVAARLTSDTTEPETNDS